MTPAPTVSVIMAVYDGADLLPETLASLKAQRFADWELVAVDDGSTDDSVAVLQALGDPRVRVIRSEVNGGPVVARNRAFAEARGRYIAGLDQDDVCLPDRFARQVDYLDAHPGTVLVSSAADVLKEGRRLPGNWPRPLTPGLIDWLMHVQNPIVWSSVMFRAEAGRRLDPLERPALRYVEDFDLYQRLRGLGRIDQIDAVLLLYRVHAGGASNRFNATMRAHAELVLKEANAADLGEARAALLAPLLVRHAMAREPVPDSATLERLVQGIVALRDAFVARARPDADTLAAIDREIAGLFWRLRRTGVRSGAVLLHQTQHAAMGPLSLGQRADLLASQLIGGVRRIRRSAPG